MSLWDWFKRRKLKQPPISQASTAPQSSVSSSTDAMITLVAVHQILANVEQVPHKATSFDQSPLHHNTSTESQSHSSHDTGSGSDSGGTSTC